MTTPIEFDRREVLDLLEKRIQGFSAGYRQNVALLGMEGIGKSTLLRHWAAGSRRPDSSLLMVYHPTGPMENLVEWAARFIQTLLYAVLHLSREETPLPTQWPALLERCRQTVPSVVRAAERLLAQAEVGKGEAAYALVWDLPALAAQELGVQVLLLLDEFQHLRSLPVKDPFQVLGRKVMVQSSVMYLVVSSEPAAARVILKEGLSLLFGQFEIAEMRALSPGASLQAIRSIFPEGAADRFLEFLLVTLGQGHPEHLNGMLEALAEFQAEGKETSGETLLPRLMERLLLHPDSVLRRRYESRLRSLPDHWSRLYCVRLLSAVAGGAHRLPEMAEAVSRPLAQVRRFVAVLLQKEIVRKEGSFYHIPDRLFSLWMVAAYPALHGVGLAGADQGRAQFQEKIQRWMAIFRREFYLPLEEKVADCMRRWTGEWIELDGHRTLLPHCREVSALEGIEAGMAPPPAVAGEADPASGGRPSGPTSGGGVILLGRTRQKGQREWGVGVAKGQIGETEAHRWVDAFSRPPELRQVRRVLVSLHPMGVNARLVLQQAKVRLWDAPLVNHLLDLYGITPMDLPERVGGQALETGPTPVPASPERPVPSASEAAG